MPSLLLAESGSTKTDWRLLKAGKVIAQYKTGGINPYLQSEADLKTLLATELPADLTLPKSGSIAFYGAGLSAPEKQAALSSILSAHFGIKAVEVGSDMLGAARGLCGSEKGVVCILGTGSNSCYYDGNAIADQHASLGYIAGDEGSGNYLGKRVLQYYAYKTFDETLMAYFEAEWGSDLPNILSNLYQKPFPNRYLAGFVKLLIDNRGHYMVENILEDVFTEFLRIHIFKYRQSWQGPVHFAGSVAAQFRDVLSEVCEYAEVEVGEVIAHPIDALVKYHTQLPIASS